MRYFKMPQKNKVLSRFLMDLSGAFIGLLIGLLCLQFFRNGLSLPLDNTDWLVLISCVFTALLLSSIAHKIIVRLVKPITE